MKRISKQFHKTNRVRDGQHQWTKNTVKRKTIHMCHTGLKTSLAPTQQHMDWIVYKMYKRWGNNTRWDDNYFSIFQDRFNPKELHWPISYSNLLEHWYQNQKRNSKSKWENENNVVGKNGCMNCHKCWIGQNGRNVRTRIFDCKVDTIHCFSYPFTQIWEDTFFQSVWSCSSGLSNDEASKSRYFSNQSVNRQTLAQSDREQTAQPDWETENAIIQTHCD